MTALLDSRSHTKPCTEIFDRTTYDAASMETLMDWSLIYRTPLPVRALAAAIPSAEIAGIEQFSDENRHVTYMRVTKQ